MPGPHESANLPVTHQPQSESLEELVLELTDLNFQDSEGVPRASGRARLIYYYPATSSKPTVTCLQSWRLKAPLGPIEAEDLRWYLEEYIRWPSGVDVIQNRARRVEESLAEWGRLLYRTAFPIEHTTNVIKAWNAMDAGVHRRFSVLVDDSLGVGADEEAITASHAAATELLGLPWELLHDGEAFLFQGETPTRVRRRLPNTENLAKDFTKNIEFLAAKLPIRILLITARPEDDACSYIDHRVSALPLVEGMEQLPGLVEIEILHPSTFPALREALAHARRQNKNYHVLHFNGHGVYDSARGHGGLCFEEPKDSEKLAFRRHHLVTTEALGPLLREHHIPLVFLEACQSAKAEKATESIASSLLKNGIPSVVAMSHSVLVETARRFVAAFYGALTEGARVGDAMLAGQKALKNDIRRGEKPGGETLTLEDWFVPVLFQQEADPVLFPGVSTDTPTGEARETFREGLARRLENLPKEPETGFIGRSRELLTLERLLQRERYAVIRGQGGEGKTALAAEFARWQVRSQQIQRAIFLSVEGLEANLVESVLDGLGRQLVKPDFSTQADCHGKMEKAEQKITHALRKKNTLLILDNMESILPPPYLAQETTALLQEAGEEALAELLALCGRLLQAENTQLIFTSRETLPAPFHDSHNRIELFQLHTSDAIQLVERVLRTEGGGETIRETSREEIGELVTAVNCHARTLTLIAPAIRERGVHETRESLFILMAEMETKFPGERENSLFASVALSLERLSPENRERVKALAPFQGCVNLDVLRAMMEWEDGEENSLADELLETGLATPNAYNHFSLNSALCPYLRLAPNDFAQQHHLAPSGRKGEKFLWDRLKDIGRFFFSKRVPDAAKLTRWLVTMKKYVRFLEQQSNQDTQMAARLTLLELPNLFAMLEIVSGEANPTATIALATDLYGLLQFLGQPLLLEHVGTVRDAAAAKLKGAWSHAAFQVARTRIEQQLYSGQLQGALMGAQELLQRAQQAGEDAYAGADYDLAMSLKKLGQVLKFSGNPQQGLHLLREAEQRFEKIGKQGNKDAEGMASICLAEQGDCFLFLGRLEEAATTYEENIRRADKLNDARQVAIGKTQLGTVRIYQRRYEEALDAFEKSRERFVELNEPSSIATTWDKSGTAYRQMGEPEQAEAAYRKALNITVRINNVTGQAETLGKLGLLYDDPLDRPEEAAVFLRQAIDKCVEIGDAKGEGIQRTNLAKTLRKLQRLSEARAEIQRVIECNTSSHHAVESWTCWSILADIEQDADNLAAAAAAKEKAVATYLTYRRDGAENHAPPGRMALSVTRAIRNNEPKKAGEFMQQIISHPEIGPPFQAYFRALQQILSGNRDPKLADDPALDYMMIAEIRLLLEKLENHRR
uniref:Tetratricopeptide repeat-containing protein n=1 Tax=Candidatus Kentrum sp. MB TaxID=2138164 RepID=A0A450XB58_9GAMM|nr:MAG: Tetratricopeptide repeat-containing protein [Candidatus Kentron sp. MB]VFK26503.1 MAG: Tetratricopeptide repeat-containing protein [Candidatus Kentron sp. MB]VFK74565.1 MAG: Tetratricopeptide repeat-containing protein [Candidatus Kentron sp. MB]